MKRAREQSLTRPLEHSSERLLEAPRSAIRKHAIGRAVHSVLALHNVMDGHRTFHALRAYISHCIESTTLVTFVCRMRHARTMSWAAQAQHLEVPIAHLLYLLTVGDGNAGTAKGCRSA